MDDNRLQSVVQSFRILNNWKIQWDNSGKFYSQSTIFPRYRKAWIYPWDPELTEPEPKDFILHEVLHCALRALVSMDKRRPKEIIQAEELLVQDICNICINH